MYACIHAHTHTYNIHTCTHIHVHIEAPDMVPCRSGRGAYPPYGPTECLGKDPRPGCRDQSRVTPLGQRPEPPAGSPLPTLEGVATHSPTHPWAWPQGLLLPDPSPPPWAWPVPVKREAPSLRAPSAKRLTFFLAAASLLCLVLSAMSEPGHVSGAPRREGGRLRQARQLARAGSCGRTAHAPPARAGTEECAGAKRTVGDALRVRRLTKF